MKILKTERKLCMCCMEEHEVQTVEVLEKLTFKGKKVEYNAIYEYCDLAEEFLSTEDMITNNDIAMKDAYRRQCGLLTSKEIILIRKKYSISQKDLASLLGWGEKTITRYEGHQVQDIAHDSVLRKINDDPEWFLELLKKAKERISLEAYDKYKEKISKEYEIMQDAYLRKSIQAQYVKYQDDPNSYGNTKLNFEKIIAVICYFANSSKVSSLYKVKLMKMLWYADFLSYKRHNHSITGLVYKAMPMGALPVAHKLIVDLKGIVYDEIYLEYNSGYKFMRSDCEQLGALTVQDINVLDTVIDTFGNYSREEIVDKMHEEVAYRETNQGAVISFEHAKELDLV